MNIMGKYLLNRGKKVSGSTFEYLVKKDGSINLRICRRSKDAITKNKPELYLTRDFKGPTGNYKNSYVSSLFPINEGSLYQFDITNPTTFKKRFYTLKIISDGESKEYLISILKNRLI
jgi:hypothetical protein